jgi:DNA primase
VVKEAASKVLSVEGRELSITNPDKLYFSQARISKLDLVHYYLKVAPGAIAGIRDRPIVLKRFVNGAEGEAFYQKRAPAARPPWLRTRHFVIPFHRRRKRSWWMTPPGSAWIVNLDYRTPPAPGPLRRS